MPSARHQAIVELFRERPSLAVELLRGPGGVRVPRAVRVATVERTFSDMSPPDYSADLVLHLSRGRFRLACVVEAQLRSAATHGRGRDAERVGKIAVAASLAVPEERRRLYIDLVLASLGQAARQAVEQMMTQNYQYQSELFRRLVKEGREEGRDQGRKEGVAQAKAADVLRVLRARGIRVPKRAEARIGKCRDIRTLDRWITRAVTVSRASELFE